MKNKQPFSPAGFSYTILRQVCNLIPPHLVKRLAELYGVDDKSRTFSPWSHEVSLVYAQMTHAVSLNDVCDGLRMNETMLTPIRGATAPAKNTLSHANRERSPLMAEALYCEVMEHLMTQSPPFAKGKVRRGYLRRFRTAIHAMDSTTIKLVAKSMDWAKHRRRKAAAKCHIRLDLQCLLPKCVIIDTAKFHDNTKARDLCSGLQAGEIVVFDKAYVDFDHLAYMDREGIFWVCRAKDNMNYRVVKTLDTTDKGIEKEYDLIIEADIYTRADAPIPGNDAEFIIAMEASPVIQDGQPQPHAVKDQRSLLIVQAIARMMDADPSLIMRARHHLGRLLQDKQGAATQAIAEWRQLLETYSPRQIRQLLVSTSSRANRLRQSSPFFAVLTVDERNKVLSALEKMK